MWNEFSNQSLAIFREGYNTEINFYKPLNNVCKLVLKDACYSTFYPFPLPALRLTGINSQRPSVSTPFD